MSVAVADQEPIPTEQEDKWAESKARTAPYRWKPGQSGNPKGRPVLDVVERMLREKAREERIAVQWVEDLERSGTLCEDVALRQTVRKDLMDRVNGKAPQSVTVTVEAPDPEAEMEAVDPW